MHLVFVLMVKERKKRNGKNKLQTENENANEKW